MRRVVRWIIRAFATADEASESPALQVPVKSPASPAPVTVVAECLPLSPKQKAIAALLTMYLAFQVVLPLRHFAYPGNVSWTEEGHNFSWHMKLRTKRGDALFTVSHPATGTTWAIDPRNTWNRASS